MEVSEVRKRLRETVDRAKRAAAAQFGRIRVLKKSVNSLATEPWPSASPTGRLVAAFLSRLLRGELPAGWDATLPIFPADAKGMATRVASGKVLNAVAANLYAAHKVALVAYAAPSTSKGIKSNMVKTIYVRIPGFGWPVRAKSRKNSRC